MATHFPHKPETKTIPDFPYGFSLKPQKEKQKLKTFKNSHVANPLWLFEQRLQETHMASLHQWQHPFSY